MADDPFISPRDTLARLVRLETKICLKFEELDKALALAREQAASNRSAERAELERRLTGMNEFQKRMDKLEGTFATKEALNRVERVVYIGIGIVIALELFIKMLMKG